MTDVQSVRLEIYIVHNGRWEIHSSFSMEQREVCIEEAKRLDASGQFGGVCVVRETYNPADNTSREAVIYHSPKLSSAPPVSKVVAGDEFQGGFVSEGVRKKGAEPKRPKSEPAATPPKKKAAAPAKKASRPSATRPVAAARDTGKPLSLGYIAPRLLFALAVSLIGAFAIAYLTYTVMQYLPGIGIPISKSVGQWVLIAAFAIGFLNIFVPTARRLLPGFWSGRGSGPAAKAARPAAPPAVPPSAPRSGPDAAPRVAQVQLEAVPEPQPVGEAATGVEREEPKADPAPPEPPPEAVETAAGAKSPAHAEVSGALLRFVGDSLEPLAGTGRPMDAFNRFGLTLYLAGAGDYLGMQHGLERRDVLAILSNHARMLGHSPEMARGFCANIEEYLIQPRYFAMYDAGRQAMAQYKRDPAKGLATPEVLDSWNAPAQEAGPDREFVAVFFTDIVGSTAMTQARGDAGAQVVVRTHNTLVREALALHSGKEIKHTGDGIMATFGQVSDAVAAGSTIQKSCFHANLADPELGLGICIGINAGEPIHEDGDIFGTPVQLAARVLAIAEHSEVAVSTVVRDLCSGKDVSFSKKGDFPMKGFGEPVPVYLVNWNAGQPRIDFAAQRAAAERAAPPTLDEAAA